MIRLLVNLTPQPARPHGEMPNRDVLCYLGTGGTRTISARTGQGAVKQQGRSFRMGDHLTGISAKTAPRSVASRELNPVGQTDRYHESEM